MATRVTKGLGGKRSIRDRRRVGLSLLAVATVLLAGPSIAPSALAASTARLVRDINPGGAGSDRFDPDVPDLGRPANVGGNVFFPADDGTHGLELWRSNGTKTGTKLVKDINPGDAGSYPSDLTNVGGTLFFAASDPIHGTELWRSDGTATGTRLVKDIDIVRSDPRDPVTSSSNPSELTGVAGTLFFAADDGIHGRELWKSDGTEAGTTLVKDIDPAILSSDPSDPTNVAAAASSYPLELTNVAGTLFLNADDGDSGRELWKSDGTASGTTLVTDINPGSANSQPDELTDVAGTLFFAADDGIHGAELWKSDGTASGTSLVMDINPGSGESGIYGLTNVTGTVFFAAGDGQLGGPDGYELWKSDGTAEGTQMVKDIYPGVSSSLPADLTNFAGALFFQAADSHGAELWRSDGTPAGTQLVLDIYPSPAGSAPDALTEVADTLFFSATDPSSGRELWRSDGTVAGTALVRDIKPGLYGSLPHYLTSTSGTLFFFADDGTHGDELWKATP